MSKLYKAVKSVVKSVVNVVKSVVKAVVNVVSGVLKFATQAFMGMLGGAPDLSNNAAATQQAQGIQLQRSGSIISIPVVYGYRKVGGITPFIETGSSNNKYLWVSYVFSEGPIEGLYKLYLNDIDLDTGNSGTSIIARLNNGETVDVTWGKFTGRVKMRFFPGVYHSDPSTSTVGDIVLGGVFNGAPNFTRSMVYNGLATLFVRFEYLEIKTQQDADSNPWDGSVPRIQAELLGRKVQRLYTNTGNVSVPVWTKITSTETNSWYSPANESYSTNPAEILLDYLRNQRYGKGLSNSEIDWDSWYKTAYKCNQYVNFTSSTQGSILQLHPVIETEQSIFNNVKLLLQQFRAYMPYTQGTYKLKIEDAGHPTDITSGNATIVATFTNDNIVGSVSYTGIDRASKYNQVIVTYVDPTPTGKFTNQTVVYPETEAERQTYISQDGGREYKLEITMPAITNYAIAKDMARLLFNKSRYQETCTVTVTSQAFELELGDNIYIQSKILNFNTIPWRVVSIKYNDDYSFELGCVRNPDSIYPYVTVGEPDTVLATYLPKGAQIYYPPNVETTPHIGLRPPNKVRLPDGSSTSDNPTTNPNPSGNPDEPNNLPGNTTPELPSLVDRVTFTGTPTVNNISGQIYARIPFSTPSTPFYAGVTISYYLANSIDETISTTAYGFTNVSGGLLGDVTTFDHTVLPGPGGSTSIIIGPLDSSLYEVRARVYYSDGQYSTLDEILVLDPSSSVIDTSINALPKVISDVVDTSSVRAVGVPKYSRDESTRTLWKDGVFGLYADKSKSGAYITTTDIGQNQGYMHLWLYTHTPSEISNRVTGVNFYYKLPNQTHYSKQTIINPNWLSGSLLANQLHDTFNYADSNTSKAINALVKMGLYDYDAGVISDWSANKTLNCIVRLVYTNGTESAYEHRLTFTYPGQFSNSWYSLSNNPILYDAFTGTRVTEHPLGTFKFDTWTTNKWSSPVPVYSYGQVYTIHTPLNIPVLGLYSGSDKMPALYANGSPISGETLTQFANLSKRYIRMGVNKVSDGGGSGTPSITLRLVAPSASTVGNGSTGSDRSYWRGTKISYRAVKPGFTVPWTTVIDRNITTDLNGNGHFDVTITSGIIYDQLYEIVITPQILDVNQSGYTATNTTTPQDAYYSLYGIGFVNNVDIDGYPTNGNWNWAFNWNTVRTSYALQSFESTLPAMNTVLNYPGAQSTQGTSPFPQIMQFTTRCVNKDVTRAIASPNAKELAGGHEINFYHQVKLHVGHIANYSKLYVYRRHNTEHLNETLVSTGLFSTFARASINQYTGMGRWERITVTTSPTSGNITLNLRGPTHYGTFDAVTNANVTLANGTTRIVSAEEEGQEFLFVVEQTGNIISPLGSFITTQRATGGVDTNQLSPIRYTVIPTSELQYVTDPFTGQLIGRSLSEARTTVLTANLVGFSDSLPYSNSGNLAGISKSIIYPTTDFGANISPAIV